MAVVIITPPEPLLTTDLVRRHLGTDYDADMDLVLDDLLMAAQWEIEPPSWVGRAFGQQVLELRLDETAWYTNCNTGYAATIPLPYPPLALDPDDGTPLVESVKYLDTDNVLQTLSTSVWRVTGAGGTGVAKIALAYNQSWPSTLCDPEAIRVRFTAGYAADDPQLQPVRNALILSIGQMKSISREDMFLVRENVPGVGTQEWGLSTDASGIIQKTVDRLLAKYWMPALG